MSLMDLVHKPSFLIRIDTYIHQLSSQRHIFGTIQNRSIKRGEQKSEKNYVYQPYMNQTRMASSFLGFTLRNQKQKSAKEDVVNLVVIFPTTNWPNPQFRNSLSHLICSHFFRKVQKSSSTKVVLQTWIFFSGQLLFHNQNKNLSLQNHFSPTGKKCGFIV